MYTTSLIFKNGEIIAETPVMKNPTPKEEKAAIARATKEGLAKIKKSGRS